MTPSKSEVHLHCKITLMYAALICNTIGPTCPPFHSQGILLDWALELVLKEVDREADNLVKNDHTFHCQDDWSWDSLCNFSLQSQHDIATQHGPIIWLVLMAIAIGKGRREADQEGKRDPWQVM